MSDVLPWNPSEFQEPPAHFWPGYFWVINDQMTEARLVAQLRDMYAQGARSVCFHALPPEFRTDDFGSGMSPPYLSPKFFALVRTVVDECRRLGLNYWLYDEGGWPSGSAAGRVNAHDPLAYGPKIVAFRESYLGRDEHYTVPPTVLCAAVRAGAGWRVFLPGEVVTGLDDDAVLRTFFVQPRDFHYAVPGRFAPYVDVLCAAATKVFIGLTHERYAQHLTPAFGTTIRFAFLDEPAVVSTDCQRQLTWTSDLATVFRERQGYDLIPWLPALLDGRRDGEDPRLTRARVDFYDVWSQLLVERFLLPIREWCRAHGLQSAGHFGGEDEPSGNADHGYGHILRALRGLDLPGVDAIWRQLFPGKRSHHFVKYASSVARQHGQPYVFTESCAVYGSGLTLAQMKWLVDQQYVRGATLAVFSNYPYSTREHRMPFCRPHFGASNPLWRHIRPLHEYAARLGYLLACGRPVCTTAVYYDVRSIWAGSTARQRALALHDELAEALLQAQCDFDFVDDDLLAGDGAVIAEGALVVGPMRYTTVLVPATRWLAPRAAAGLGAFIARGGTVIAVEGLPGCDGAAAPADWADRLVPATVAEAVRRVAPVVRLSTPCPDVRACRRDLGGAQLYFLTNEADRPIRVTVHVDATGPAADCDLESGQLHRLETPPAGPGASAVDLEFAPWGSHAILFGVAADPPAPRFTPGVTVSLTDGWRLRPRCRFRVGEHDYEVLELPDATAVPCPLGDWRPLLGDGFSGDAEYTIEFSCTAAQAAGPALLQLGEVRYVAAVTLNDRPAGRRVWKPFALRLDGLLKAGQNQLRVVVTNTLANAILDPEAAERWRRQTGPGWRAYDPIARPFEPDSLPSGLCGPVSLVFGA